MNDPLRKALGKLVEAAELLNEHAPPGDELENAEALKMARDAQELADAEAASHPWCLECGEEFHDDDTGGYNPECRCGKEWCVGLCRSCCHAVGEKYPPDEDEV